MRHLLCTVGVAVLLSACSDSGPTFTSEYTTINRDKCTLLSQDVEMGTASWRCEPFRGIEVHMSEGDLRAYLSFQTGGEGMWINNPSVAPYNKLGKTLEWRLAYEGERWTPVATIVRTFTQIQTGEDEFAEGEVLVVSRFDGKETCHMAYVDVPANPDAIGLARDTADVYALDFECGEDEVIRVGNPGASLPLSIE